MKILLPLIWLVIALGVSLNTSAAGDKDKTKDVNVLNTPLPVVGDMNITNTPDINIVNTPSVVIENVDPISVKDTNQRRLITIGAEVFVTFGSSEGVFEVTVSSCQNDEQFYITEVHASPTSRSGHLDDTVPIPEFNLPAWYVKINTIPTLGSSTVQLLLGSEGLKHARTTISGGVPVSLNKLRIVARLADFTTDNEIVTFGVFVTGFCR